MTVHVRAPQVSPSTSNGGGDLRFRARTNTPLVPLRITVGRTTHFLRLKLEQANPTGSIKYRTAIGLAAALDADYPLGPGTTVVESTSGNLGIALARVLGELGCRFIAVVDPKVPRPVHDLLMANGATIVEVATRDAHGGYLLTRLAKVQELLDSDSDLRWTDQYTNRANPEIHRTTLALELVAQTAGTVDAVLIAVSTGGTLAGISESLRLTTPSARIYAVDVKGSLVTSDHAHAHLLTGLGATRKSSFLRIDHYDQALRVADTDAIACCRMLAHDTGLALGGSGGAVIAAFIDAIDSKIPVPRCPVAVIADGGEKYRSTLYDDTWLAARSALNLVMAAEQVARHRKVTFQLLRGDHG
jgi:N-(2-amino-2-carboxyethyl)-L-glutamate synthase